MSMQCMLSSARTNVGNEPCLVQVQVQVQQYASHHLRRQVPVMAVLPTCVPGAGSGHCGIMVCSVGFLPAGTGTATPTSGTASERRASQRLAALAAVVAAKEREVKRLQRQSEEKALQAKLRQLQEQERMLKARPAHPATAAAAGRPPVPPHRPAPVGHGSGSAYSEDVYSEEHHRSGTDAGQSGSVVDDEVGEISDMALPAAQAPARRAVPAPRSVSVSDEVGGLSASGTRSGSEPRAIHSGSSESYSYTHSFEDEVGPIRCMYCNARVLQPARTSQASVQYLVFWA
jgi:hypothetical protein